MKFKMYKLLENGRYEEGYMESGSKEFKSTGRILRKWNGPSVEDYHDNEVSCLKKVLPDPPPEDKRITFYDPSDLRPYWLVPEDWEG